MKVYCLFNLLGFIYSNLYFLNLAQLRTGGATQSEMQEIQQSQMAIAEESEVGDGVSSEGEKPAVEGIEVCIFISFYYLLFSYELFSFHFKGGG